MACKTVEELKAAVLKFIAMTDEVHDEYNGMLVWDLCHHLTDALKALSELYAAAPHSSEQNAIIIPHENAPIMMLSMSIPLSGNPKQTINGLKKIIARCDEFSSPIENAVTPDEIEAVLDAAEKNSKSSALSRREPRSVLCG